MTLSVGMKDVAGDREVITARSATERAPGGVRPRPWARALVATVGTASVVGATIGLGAWPAAAQTSTTTPSSTTASARAVPSSTPAATTPSSTSPSTSSAATRSSPRSTRITLEPVTISYADALAVRQLCLRADLIPDGYDGLPSGVSRDIAVATCIQRFPENTYLDDSGSPTNPRTLTPPRPDGSAATQYFVTIAPPVQPPPTPVVINVPPPSVSVGVNSSTSVSGGGGSSGGSSSGGGSGGGSGGSGGGSSSLPIGDTGGAGVADSSGTATATDGGSDVSSDPALLNPGLLASAGAEGADLPGVAPGGGAVPVVGLPGTVSDPTTNTAAEAAETPDRGLPVLLVVGVLVVAAALGLGVRGVLGHQGDLGERLTTMVPFLRGRSTGNVPAAPDGEAGAFVDRWVSWGDRTGPIDVVDDEDGSDGDGSEHADTEMFDAADHEPDDGWWSGPTDRSTD